MPPVDECTLKPDLCGDGVCRDTDDGYTCECFSGFTNAGGSDRCYGETSLLTSFEEQKFCKLLYNFLDNDKKNYRYQISNQLQMLTSVDKACVSEVAASILAAVLPARVQPGLICHLMEEAA